MSDFEEVVVKQELGVQAVVKPPPRNAPKGPTDAEELILLHGKERSNKLQSLRVTRNAAVKIVKKNTAKLRDACQSVLSLHEELHELKSDTERDEAVILSTIFSTDASPSRQRLCAELDILVETYKSFCVFW